MHCTPILYISAGSFASNAQCYIHELSQQQDLIISGTLVPASCVLQRRSMHPMTFSCSQPVSMTSDQLVHRHLQMSVEAVQEHLNWSSESVERCAVLSTEAGRPSHIRQLFHAPVQGQPANSCLLHQMARLLSTGLAASSEACSRASELAYGVATAGNTTRAAIAKAAAAVCTSPSCVNSGVGYCRISCSLCVGYNCTHMWHPMISLLFEIVILEMYRSCNGTALWASRHAYSCARLLA